MSRILALELTDAEFDAVGKIAARRGRAPEDVALEAIRDSPAFKDAIRPEPTETELAKAREQLMKFVGSFSSGDPHSADNERLDRDLAEEYASTHDTARNAIAAEELRQSTRLRERLRTPLPKAEQVEALQQLLRFAGSYSSGDPNSSNNDRIDADLARVYDQGRDQE